MSEGARIRAGVLEFIDICAESKRQLCLGSIFTTVLTPCDLSRYVELLENDQNPKARETPKRSIL